MLRCENVTYTYPHQQSPAVRAEESTATSRRLATRGKRRPALGVVETAQRYYLDPS